MIRLCFVVLSMSGAIAFGQVTNPPGSQAVQDDASLASFDEVKTIEDIARVKKREVRVTLKFVDAADSAPIEGVRAMGRIVDFVSDRDGLIKIDLPSERGIRVGQDVCLEISERHLQKLSKGGEPIDTSGLVLPRVIRLPYANQPLGVSLEPISVPLRFDGSTIRGKVEVDVSAIDSTDAASGVRLWGAVGVFADFEIRDGVRYLSESEEVVLGPFSVVPERGLVRVWNDFFPVKLEENFDLRVKLERKVAVVRVEMPDQVQLFAIRDKYGVLDINGATFIRVTDGYASSFHALERPSLDVVKVKVPPGRYVVVPGLFDGCAFHLPVFNAIFAGIDVTKFPGLTTIDIKAPINEEAELQELTVQASVRDAIRAIETIKQELSRHDALKLNQGKPSEGKEGEHENRR